MKLQRIVSSRVVIKAHHAQIYRFLDNFDNHRQILPGVADWTGDKDSARYSQLFGLGRQRAESKIVERHVGLRVCEESNGSSGLRFKRYYKIQQDDQTSVCEISMVFQEGMSLIQRIFTAPLLKSGLDQSLLKLKAIMERPKETRVPAPTSIAATPPPSAVPATPTPPAPVAAPPVAAGE